MTELMAEPDFRFWPAVFRHNFTVPPPIPVELFYHAFEQLFGLSLTMPNTMTTMRLPSRLLPPRNSQRLGLSGVLFLTGLMVGFGFFIYSSSTLVRCITGALVCAAFGYTAVLNRREKRRFEVLASFRKGESICEFAQSFDTRLTDTWVIRATHQELQLFLRSYMVAFPVRASDLLLNDLQIDFEDVEDLLLDIAERSGRSLDKTEENSYYGKVNTVMDLVLFINAQPRKL